jgi:hypothetical protein
VKHHAALAYFRPINSASWQATVPNMRVANVLSHIEPPDDFDQNERIFECAKCAYSEATVTEFR